MSPPVTPGDDLRLGLLEPSESLDNHTARWCRVAGSFETVPHRRATVSVRLGRRRATEVVDSGETGEGRFDLYVAMPRLRKHPVLVVEVDDGVRAVRRRCALATPVAPKSRAYRGYTSTPAGQAVLARLRGHGLEFGALHMPAPLDPARTTVDYADRLTRDQAIAEFPELAPDVDRIVSPSVLLDLDRDDLGAIDAARYDFFIAADVLEHLANPIGFLANLTRVMRPGAVLLLVVPDRDFTFDFTRRLTAFEHLEEEYRTGVDEVDDDHILDYLAHATAQEVPTEPEARRLMLDRERFMSVHAHVWNQVSFDDFIERVLERHLCGVRVVERVPSVEAGGAMVYLLRRDAEEEGAAGA